MEHVMRWTSEGHYMVFAELEVDVSVDTGYPSDLKWVLPDDVDDFESLDDVVAEPDAPSAEVTFFLLPDLKSVSYQPPPLRRKPAAEIFFFRASAAHSGQVTSGGSLTFCRTSIS